MLPGPWELILILLIVLVMFGGKRIPEIMGGVGKGIRLFKKSVNLDDAPTASPQTRPGESSEEKTAPK